MSNIPTAVYFDSSRNRWVVEYGGPDHQEHFIDQYRAYTRAISMGWVPFKEGETILVDYGGDIDKAELISILEDTAIVKCKHCHSCHEINITQLRRFE